VSTLLEKVGLEQSRKIQLRKFSKGMIQRIGIAQAIVNDPEVVFLDEPMSGLDPLGRREVRQVIAGLKLRGVTVFFSSHILPDVEALCDRVAIVNRGRMQAAGALHEILQVKIQGHEIILSGASPAAASELGKMSDQVTALGDRLYLRVATQPHVSAILQQAQVRDVDLISVNPIRPSLEDFFFQEVTGQPVPRGPGED
jgi:ABC-2 type transport system ATP-binding protein